MSIDDYDYDYDEFEDDDDEKDYDYDDETDDDWYQINILSGLRVCKLLVQF